MNNRENALKLRVIKLEQEKAALKLTFDRMLSDIEMTESAGCAFVWELTQTMWKWTHTHVGWDGGKREIDLLSCPPNPREVQRSWEAALAAGESFQQAKTWLREQIATDPVWKKTAIEAADKDPNMELETPFGKYSLRLLTAT